MSWPTTPKTEAATHQLNSSQKGDAINSLTFGYNSQFSQATNRTVCNQSYKTMLINLIRQKENLTEAK